MAQGDNEAAVRLIRRAIDVVDRYDRAVIRQATSRVNLACALMDLAKEAGPEESAAMTAEARTALDEAIRRYEDKGGNDYHYAAALSALADLQLREGSYAEAADNYRRSIELVRLYMGDNQNVRMLEGKLQAAQDLAAGTGKPTSASSPDPGDVEAVEGR